MAGEGVLELTDSNFEQEVLNSDKPVLVDFWAEWCQPCRMLAPTIDELAKEFTGKVKIGKVDTDHNRNVSMKFDVTAIPTVILFKNGQIVRKFIGLNPKKMFVDELQKISG